MIKRFAISNLIILSMISCTTDTFEGLFNEEEDSEYPDETIENVEGGKGFFLIVRKHFLDGTMTQIDSTEFLENKITRTLRYDPSDQLLSTTTWFYLENGLFDSLQTQLPDGTKRVREKVAYAPDGKLTKWIFAEDLDGRFHMATSLYNYENQNEIHTESPNGDASETTYILTENNLINKAINGTGTNEVLWDEGYNPVRVTGSRSTVEFELLDQPVKKEFMYNFWPRIFGNKNNYLLWSNRFSFINSEFTFGDKYIASQNDGSSKYEFQYVFDEEEFLIKKTTLLNGSLQSETEYFYR